MAENPFIFGKVVRGSHFCDRVPEMALIGKMVRSRQHMVVISPRRYGKTSLVINALEKSKIPYIYLDCSFIEDERSLLEALVNDYAKKLDTLALLEKFLRRFDISFSVILEPLSVSVREVRTESLKSLIVEIGKNYVLVFDEFQDIQEKNGKLVNKLRSAIQFLGSSAIMLGSKRHLLNSMFLTPRGIFYNFGQAIHLGKIGKNSFTAFISGWFKKSGIGLPESEVDRLLAITECHPFFTQYFCHFLFEKRLAGKTGVEQVLGDILEMNSAFYESTFGSLPSSQRKALLLLSAGSKGLYSAGQAAKFGIKSSQSLQKALSSLTKKEIIDKNGSYFILDVFFRHWLYQKVLNQKV